MQPPTESSLENSKEGAGVLIRTLRKGTGTYKPQPDDLCVVQYQGFRLKGDTMIPLDADPTKIRPPIEFQVGAGHVMEGWDVAVQHLVQGQQAEVTIPFLFAYGEQGYLPKIPPRTTLVYRMELLSITRAKKNIERRGNGGRG